MVYVILAIIAQVGFRILYWVPYHINLANRLDKDLRGRHLASFSSIAFIFQAITPAVIGFTIDTIGFGILFMAALVFLCFSVVPLFFLESVDCKYRFSYIETFRELFKKKNFKMLLGYGADGAQGAVGSVFWPIFIFQILEENYVSMGLISTAVILFNIVFRLVMGKLSDKYDTDSLVNKGSILCATAWFLKSFVRNGFQVFLASAYHSFAGISKDIPFSSFIYGEILQHKDGGDEYTVLREVALNGGRFLMLIICLMFLQFFDLNWVFILAGIFSLIVIIL